MKIINIGILLMCISIFSGCYKDKGNYDYVELNEIEISGLKESYDLFILDTLRLEPEIDYTLVNNPNVSYKWTLGLDKVVGTEKNLEFVVPNDIPRIEHLLLTVSDNTTGISKRASVLIVSEQLYSKGWLILSEKDGKSDLSFIRRDDVYDDEVEEDYKYTEFFDVYSSPQNEGLGSVPLQIHEHWRSGMGNTNGHIMLVQKGGQGCVDLFGGNLSKSFNTDQEFMALPADYDPKEVFYAEEFSYILNEDGKVFSRKNISKKAYYSGYYSDYPLSFVDDGELKEMVIDQFVPNVRYRDCGFILAFDDIKNRFLLISDYDYSRGDKSGTILTMGSNAYPNQTYIPLHDTGDNQHIYSSAYQGTSSAYTGLYNIFKTPEGKFIEQQFEIKFDKKYARSVLIKPKAAREIPSAYINENSIVDVPDGGSGYGSTNVYISNGNKLSYYNRIGGDEVNIFDYYTFDSDIISIDDQHYQNRRLCVGLANGDVYIMDVTDEAVAGKTEKLIHKVSKNLGNIKQIIFKRGHF